MVEFVLKNVTTNRVVYEYYPQADTEKLPGVISIWTKKRKIVLDVAAEDDYMTSLADEAKELKDSIDELFIELGEQPSTDEDWLSNMDDKDGWYYYADKVIMKLWNDMEQGKLLRHGNIICC